MKKTKEQLQGEVATLTEKLNEKLRQDMSIRSTLSELLGQYTYTQEYGYSKTKKEVDVKDWIGISFLIGELKADADYAMCIEAREILRQENENLKRKVYELENPVKV